MTQIRDLTEIDGARSADFFDAPWGTFRPNGLQNALINLTRNTPLQRGRMRHKMTNLICGFGSPLDIMHRDLKYRIAGQNNLIEYGLLTRPSYNEVEIEFLCDGLPEGGVALDIGCNIGLYSLPLARSVGPTGRVLSIDANAQMTRHLALHATANEFTQITPITSAVGDVSGMVDLKIRENDLAIVSVEENQDGQIPMQPLREIVKSAGITHVDALKIDIEGHEDQALVPYFESTDEAFWPARVVIEFMPPNDYPGSAMAMLNRGYALIDRTRNNSMYERS